MAQTSLVAFASWAMAREGLENPADKMQVQMAPATFKQKAHCAHVHGWLGQGDLHPAPQSVRLDLGKVFPCLGSEDVNSIHLQGL